MITKAFLCFINTALQSESARQIKIRHSLRLWTEKKGFDAYKTEILQNQEYYVIEEDSGTGGREEAGSE